MSHDRDYNMLIHSPRWHRLRHAILTHSPLCVRCKERGIITAATEVHHIIPVEIGIAFNDKARLMFNASNLQTLCQRCHHDIHREICTHSKEGVQQRTQQQLHAFTEKFI